MWNRDYKLSCWTILHPGQRRNNVYKLVFTLLIVLPLDFTKWAWFLFLCALHRPCTRCCQPSWTPTPSPTWTRTRRGPQVRVQRAGRSREGRGKRTTCPPCRPKWLGWWKSTAAPWCCRGRPVCPRRSPPRPSATSSSSPTPPCSTPCWREVRGWGKRVSQKHHDHV